MKAICMLIWQIRLLISTKRSKSLVNIQFFKFANILIFLLINTGKSADLTVLIEELTTIILLMTCP